MYRSLTTHLAVLLVGLSFGVGAVAMADRDGSPPRAGAAASPDVVSAIRALQAEVRTTNRKLDITNKNLGGYTFFADSRSVIAVLRDIERNTTR